MIFGTHEDRPNSLENLSKNLFSFAHESIKYFNAETLGLNYKRKR